MPKQQLAQALDNLDGIISYHQNALDQYCLFLSAATQALQEYTIAILMDVKRQREEDRKGEVANDKETPAL